MAIKTKFVSYCWARTRHKTAAVVGPSSGNGVSLQFCNRIVFSGKLSSVPHQRLLFSCQTMKFAFYKWQIAPWCECATMGCFIYILDNSNSSSFTFWSSQFASSSRSNWTGIWTGNSNGSWTDVLRYPVIFTELPKDSYSSVAVLELPPQHTQSFP